MRAPLLGAITLHPTGGGIAVVSNLLWQVFRQKWGANAHLETLLRDEAQTPTLRDKMRFGVAVGTAQILRRSDWVFFSHLALARAQLRIPSSLRRPYGVFLHGIEAWAPLTAAEIRAVAAADLRVANSRFTANRAMALHPDIGHVEPCPLALPSSNESEAADSAVPVRLGCHAVLIVGRMNQSERYKGHDQLIEAWPAVVDRVPDAQLVIAGGGDDLMRLKEKAAGSPSILFTGFLSRPALTALYQRAALFALPSSGEGFGLVYLEAMTHRLACVGSHLDAASEIIVDGQTGCLVDQTNIGALSDCLVSLLENDARRQMMGEAGYRRATTEFSVERFSTRLLQLLHESESNRERQVH